jgi:1-acyl-sn-glycerol-3-phosphate acyltransferase
MGWQLIGDLKAHPKAVIVGAPHTTNWDGFFAFATGFALGVRFRWIGKKELFHPLIAPLSRLLGGVPVDRHARHNAVDQIVEQFHRYDSLFIIIAPEGTRTYSPHWKTGFYYMAYKAGVPIVLARIDYAKKTVDLAAVIHPTGDLEADFERIKPYYVGLTARNPQNAGPVSLAPKDPASSEQSTGAA